MKQILHFVLRLIVGWKQTKVIYSISMAIVLFMVSASVLGSAKAQVITLKEKNAALVKVLEKISKQTKLDLIGDLKLLDKTAPVTIAVTNAPLEQVLNELAKNQPVRLIYRNKTIIVGAKSATNQSSSTSRTVSTSQEQMEISGFVSNDKGDPLEGVSIQLTEGGKTLGQTGKNGRFSILAFPNANLTFRMLGFESSAVNVNGKTELTIQLKQVNQVIEETVVTGYGTLRRENFTGAAKTITRKEIEKFNTGNVFSMLQALDPSFKVDERVEAGSNPNVLPQINIRGISSVGEYAVNAPLVILDGFEVALTNLYDLDINRIESISLLKDASSTSLYGSRGGNGVIVIETRLPKDGRFTITYDAKPNMSFVDLSDYNLMNAKEKLEYERLAGIYVSDTENPDWNLMEQEMYNNLYHERLKNVLSGVDTYWLKQPVRNTFSVNNSIRMEGGSSDVRYSLEGNYHDYKGIMKESGRTRGGAGFNLIYRIPNVITFRNIATYQYTKGYESPFGNFSYYADLNPYEKMFDAEGKYNIRFGELGQYYSFGDDVMFNPLYNAQLGFKNESVTQFISNNLSLEWFINSKFTLRGKGAISRLIANHDQYTSPFNTAFYNVTDPTLKGTYAFGDSSQMAYEGRIELQYANMINKHQINASIVTEARASNVIGNSHIVSGYADDRFITPQMALGYHINTLPVSISRPVREVGFLGSLFYTYDNRYNLSFTARSDGASIYGHDNRFGTFWSAGASYNIHNERWFPKGVVNRLRVFGNIGTNSTVNNFNAGMVSTSYRFVSGMYYNNQYAAMYSGQGNASVRWPEQKQTSLGVDVNFLDNLLNLNVSVYDRTTNRMISEVTVAPSFGFAKNTFFQNLGKARNRGFEVLANARIYQDTPSDFTWYVTAGAVQNRSKLLEISNELRELNNSLVRTDVSGNVIAPSTYYEEGQSLDIIRAVPSLGIDPATGRELYVDRQGNSTYTWNASNQVVVGNKEPDLYGSLGTAVNYKGFSIQINSLYSLGADVFNNTLMNKIENNSPYLNADKRVLEERWKEPGDQAKYKSISDLSVTQVSSRFVQKENFWRLASVNVNYNFAAVVLEKLKLQRLKLNFSMNDPFRLSSVRMERGLEYPYAREYNFGVMVQF